MSLRLQRLSKGRYAAIYDGNSSNIPEFTRRDLVWAYFPQVKMSQSSSLGVLVCIRFARYPDQ